MNRAWPVLKNSLSFWAGVALLSCGLIVGAWGLHNRQLDERFAKEGVSAQGQIIAKKKENNADSDPRYLLQVEFSGGGPKASQFWQAVPEPFWNTSAEGQKIPVSYLRTNPATARVDSPLVRETGKGQLTFALIAGPIGVISLAAALLKLSRTASRNS
jgi:hypothetical protein